MQYGLKDSIYDIIIYYILIIFIFIMLLLYIYNTKIYILLYDHISWYDTTLFFWTLKLKFITLYPYSITSTNSSHLETTVDGNRVYSAVSIDPQLIKINTKSNTVTKKKLTYKILW